MIEREKKTKITVICMRTNGLRALHLHKYSFIYAKVYAVCLCVCDAPLIPPAPPFLNGFVAVWCWWFFFSSLVQLQRFTHIFTFAIKIHCIFGIYNIVSIRYVAGSIFSSFPTFHLPLSGKRFQTKFEKWRSLARFATFLHNVTL